MNKLFMLEAAMRTRFVKTFERYPFWTAIVIAIVLLTGAVGASARDYSLQVDASEVNRVDLDVNAGDIRLVGVSDDHVSIRVKEIDVSENCEVSLEHKGSTVELTAHIERHLLREHCELDVEIRLPASVPVNLALGAGDVDLEDLGSALRASVGAGSVEGRIRGEQVILATGAGDIEIAGLVSTVRARTGAGNIELQFDKAPQGTIHANSGVGDVEVILPPSSKINARTSTGLGSISQEFDSSAAATTVIEATTGIGDVRVEQG